MSQLGVTQTDQHGNKTLIRATPNFHRFCVLQNCMAFFFQLRIRPGTVPDELIHKECPCFLCHSSPLSRNTPAPVSPPACYSFWASGSVPTATTSLALFLHTLYDVRKTLHLTDLLPAMRKEGDTAAAVIRNFSRNKDRWYYM